MFKNFATMADLKKTVTHLFKFFFVADKQQTESHVKFNNCTIRATRKPNDNIIIIQKKKKTFLENCKSYHFLIKKPDGIIS